jgi:uncharacterized protein
MNSRTARPLALLTGASRGIGAALARELARHGHDLALCARSIEPMRALAAELREIGADTTVIAADLSQHGAAARLAEELEGRGLRIDVLVNNAGIGAAGQFDRLDPVLIGDLLQLNVVSLTELTRNLLPGMITRGHGRIMLVSSVAAFYPGPRWAVYYASKAYVLSLGEALAYELRGTGVTVTTLCPGTTATEFFEAAGVSPSGLAARSGRMMPAERVARLGYEALMAGRRLVIPGTANWLATFAGQHAPRRLMMGIVDRVLSKD